MEKQPALGQLNSVQLNVVTFVDVPAALSTQSLDGNLYMVDNSVGSDGQGTPRLRTRCKQGQVVNWLVYAMDMDKRPDGSWPPMAKINNIVFLDRDGETIAERKVCVEFKVFGAPDKKLSNLTPVYYYWAGAVLPNLPVGVYRYRLIFELDANDRSQPLYLNLDTPSLNVISIDGDLD